MASVQFSAAFAARVKMKRRRHAHSVGIEPRSGVPWATTAAACSHHAPMVYDGQWVGPMGHDNVMTISFRKSSRFDHCTWNNITYIN